MLYKIVKYYNCNSLNINCHYTSLKIIITSPSEVLLSNWPVLLKTGLFLKYSEKFRVKYLLLFIQSYITMIKEKTAFFLLFNKVLFYILTMWGFHKSLIYISWNIPVHIAKWLTGIYKIARRNTGAKSCKRSELGVRWYKNLCVHFFICPCL